MSGPKVSYYVLTAARKAAILEALRIEVCKKEFARVEADTLKIADDLKRHEHLAKEADAFVDAAAYTDQLKQTSEIATGILKAIRQGKKQKSASQMEQELQQMQTQLTSLKSQLRYIEVESTLVENKLQNALDRVIDEGLFRVTDEAAAEGRNELEGVRFREVLETMQQVLQDDFIPAALRTDITAMLEKGQNINDSLKRSFVALEVQPLLKRYSAFRAQWAQYGAEYQELLTRYETLLAWNGHEAQAELVPFQADAILKLKQLIATEELQAQEQAERAYIAASLNEVMEEMGYDIWGRRDVTKRSGRHLTKSLFRYGNGTAIDITHSDDGQITMELGLADTTDRLPSSSEAIELTAEMTAFCEDFTEIEKKLAERGIQVSQRVSRLPPSPAYAQVINVSEYDTVTEAAESTDENKRRRISGSAYLMRDGYDG